jgi:chromosome segregation and condensation protein ScpB
VYRARIYGESVEAHIEYEAALAPKYDGTSFVLTSFHFDTTYHEEQRVYAMGAFDIVRQYCRLHRADPLFRSIISEVDYLKPYFDVYPEDRETLLRVFREKRSEPDVMYNQPNEQNCGDEGLVRNFLYGQLIHGRVFGNICHAYGPGDVFGHPNQLSQIARKSGCIGVTWGKHIFNFPPFFNHLSLDGSALPHERGRATEDAIHQMGLSVRLDDIDQTPPTAWHHTLMPTCKQGTYYDLMSTIHRECAEKGAHLPVTSRDMSLYHAATAVSRVDLKIANRLGEIYEQDGSPLEVRHLPEDRVVIQLKTDYLKEARKFSVRPLLTVGPLRTLSYIAYNQPIAQREVALARGSQAYQHIKQLVQMGFVDKEKGKGRAKLLKTTDDFADTLGFSRDRSNMKRQLRSLFHRLESESLQRKQEKQREQ